MSVRKGQYYILNKPYKVLSQFSDSGANKGLTHVCSCPKDVYPVGRLDLDSEGLLLLTNDKSLNEKLLHPKYQHKRTYWIEVEGQPKGSTLSTLQKGVIINLKGQLYNTLPCTVRSIQPQIPERSIPVNREKHRVTSWLEITLVEGKNRQVRKMLAQMGHPVLRLIRVAIEDITLGSLQPGQTIQLYRKVVYSKLNLA